MSAWDTVFALVAGGKIAPQDGANLVHTLLADLAQIGSGKDLTREQVIALASATLPVVEQVAEIIFPGIAPEVAVANTILSLSHPMSPAEEKAWMDRASGGPG